MGRCSPSSRPKRDCWGSQLWLAWRRTCLHGSAQVLAADSGGREAKDEEREAERHGEGVCVWLMDWKVTWL